MKFLRSITPLWAALPLAVASAVVASACSGIDNATLPMEAQVEFGSIEVTVITVGVALDPDGYTVVIDESLSQPIGINATVEFNPLPVGHYQGLLDDVAENCSVADPNLRLITVTKDTPIQELFNVTCSAP